jgi:hypothetical protein
MGKVEIFNRMEASKSERIIKNLEEAARKKFRDLKRSCWKNNQISGETGVV